MTLTAAATQHMLVVTSDSVVYTVPEAVVARCGTLSAAVAAGVTAHVPVPVPNVTAYDMSVVVEYYIRLAELSALGVPPATAASHKTRFFAQTGTPALFSVMNAANYLDARELLEDASAYVADLIRGKTPDAIREVLNLQADTTAAESAAVRHAFAWAFPE